MTNLKVELIDIKWERIFLELIVKASLVDCFILKKDNKEIILDSEKINNDKYSLKINITNVENNNFLSNGNWSLYAKKNNTYQKATISYDLAYNIDDKSRIFYYLKNIYSYNLSFYVYSDDDITLNFSIISLFMQVNKNPKKDKVFLESTNLKEFIKKLILSVGKKGVNLLYKIFYLFRYNSNNKNIIFLSENKEYLAGNLEAVYNGMLKRSLDKEYNITVSCRKAVNNYNVIELVKLVYKLSSQNIIVVDDYAPILGFITFPKEVSLIQLWHAGLGFKSVGYSRFGKEGSPHPINSVHRKYTKAASSSDEFTKALMEVFAKDESIFVKTGMARMDNILDPKKQEEVRKNIYEKYPILKDKKIILFAPTYRGKGQQYAYYDLKKLDLDKINNFCKDKYIFAIKMHPFIENIEDVSKYSNIIDISSYKNINDLYYIMDILITDYSSNFYEASIMEKPIIFYTFDRKIYELTRGVHRSILENAPGKVCDSFKELMKALEDEDYDLEKTRKFAREEFSLDNKATDKIIDMIIEK